MQTKFFTSLVFTSSGLLRLVKNAKGQFTFNKNFSARLANTGMFSGFVFYKVTEV